MSHPMSRPLRVFLCHSSRDKAVVRKLYNRLRADGFEPWLDEENLLPGQDWRQGISKAVRNSDAVIICPSKDSVSKSGFLQKEIKFALDVAEEQPEDTIYIIPVKLEECEIPSRLRQWQWVNLYEKQGYNRLLKSLQLCADTLNSKNPSTPVRLQETPSVTQDDSDFVRPPSTDTVADNQPPQEDDNRLKNFRAASPTASWIFGSVLLIFLMVVFFKGGLDPDQRTLLRFFMALTSAFFAVFFVGGVLLKGTLNGLYISATGGFVLFILMQFVFDPFNASRIQSGPQPTPTPILTPTVSPSPPANSTSQVKSPRPH